MNYLSEGDNKNNITGSTTLHAVKLATEIFLNIKHGLPQSKDISR